MTVRRAKLPSCRRKLVLPSHLCRSSMTSPSAEDDGEYLRYSRGRTDRRFRDRELRENEEREEERRRIGNNDSGRGGGDNDRENQPDSPEEVEARKRMLRLLNMAAMGSSPSASCRTQVSRERPEELLQMQLKADELLPFEPPKSNGPVRTFARAVAQQSMAARVVDAQMMQSEQGLVIIFCEWRGVTPWLSKEGKELFDSENNTMPASTQLARITWDKWAKGVFVNAWSEARSDTHKEFKRVFPQVFNLPDVSQVRHCKSNHQVSLI